MMTASDLAVIILRLSCQSIGKFHKPMKTALFDETARFFDVFAEPWQVEDLLP
ncbi:hypothetical protein [Allorhizobium sonneratiae]|uniref:hypothetical protein n=1 Tax=Allorhizobium sonneratiae TaxID=2934936 RepID=UPI002033C00B|nr:hypothetical protein [Allorhizobium sonneratiae]